MPATNSAKTLPANIVQTGPSVFVALTFHAKPRKFKTAKLAEAWLTKLHAGVYGTR